MTTATTTARPPVLDLDTADIAIEEAARILHLPAIRAGYEEAVAHALQERSTYKQFLASILGEEVADRAERRKLRLVRDAAFPRPKRIEDFDFTANTNISPEQIATLCDPAWVRAGQPLVLIGDSGTGKSHLLIGIGTAIAEAGLKVRYTTAANLVNELAEAADERQLTRVLARYGRADLLCLDEFGCAPRGAEKPCGRKESAAGHRSDRLKLEAGRTLGWGCGREQPRQRRDGPGPPDGSCSQAKTGWVQGN
jgi:DNA replication protein DnaC